MSSTTTRTYIENRLITQLGFYHPNVQLQIANVDVDKDYSSVARVAYAIMDGKGMRANLGNRKVDRYVGELQLNIMVPKDDGNGVRDILADFLGDVFNEAEAILTDDARLRFKVPSFREAGIIGDSSVKIVSIPFWRDEAMK